MKKQNNRNTNTIIQSTNDEDSRVDTDNKGRIVMNTILLNEKVFDKEVMGLRELRGNLSDTISDAIHNFEEILSGNVKKGGETASILSTALLNEILNVYEFKPEISFDEVTGQHEIRLEEIGVYSCAETLEEALIELIELVIDSTEDFFEQKELYMRTNQRGKYPYYLRLRHCNSIKEILKVLNLDKNLSWFEVNDIASCSFRQLIKVCEGLNLQCKNGKKGLIYYGLIDGEMVRISIHVHAEGRNIATGTFRNYVKDLKFKNEEEFFNYLRSL